MGIGKGGGVGVDVDFTSPEVFLDMGVKGGGGGVRKLTANGR